MVTIYIIDLRDALKPSRTTPIKRGGPPRPLYSTSEDMRERRSQARRAGGIKRIVLHQWAAEVRPDMTSIHRLPTAEERDEEEARRVAYRAAGLGIDGRPRPSGGASYHVSVGVTSQGSGVVALVWPWPEHTFHAEKANAESIGVGLMGRFGRDDDGPRQAGLARALRIGLVLAGHMVLGDGSPPGYGQLVRQTRQVNTYVTALDAYWHHLEPVPLRTHSQTQRKSADPGLWAIRHGVAPLVGTGAVSVEPDFHEGAGEPWPESWRRTLPEGS
jgi:hypothetical protein